MTRIAVIDRRQPEAAIRAVLETACEACNGKRYVPAPPDNAWREYFKKTGQAHAVFVGCPKCNP